MGKIINCPVCGKEIDSSVSNCPYCNAMISHQEETIPEPKQLDNQTNNDPQNSIEKTIKNLEQPTQENEINSIPNQTPVDNNQEPIVQTNNQTPLEYNVQRDLRAKDNSKKIIGLILLILLIGVAIYIGYTNKEKLFPSKNDINKTNPINTSTNDCTGEEVEYLGTTIYKTEQYYYFHFGSEAWEMRNNPDYKGNTIDEKMCTRVNGYPVIHIDSILYEKNIEKFDSSSFNTTQVSSTSWMFAFTDSPNLELNLTGFDTTNNYNMIGMFSKSKLKTINISTFKITSNTTVLQMFREAKIGTLILGDQDISVEKLHDMFDHSEIGKIITSNKDTKERLETEFNFNVELK